ncbi:MAG: hypothetical protein J5814_09550 [Bacteroidaceae bacterium]|nr:hypothetical protein [Bacteroidaceae bacterium]
MAEQINNPQVEALSMRIKQLAISPDAMTRLIETETSEGKVNKRDILEALRYDHNLLDASTIIALLRSKLFSVEELLDAGLEKAYVRELFSDNKFPSFGVPSKLEHIDKPSTEIYFWGVPGSGITLAIGSIINAMTNSNEVAAAHPDIESQGYVNLIKLMRIFQDETICRVPEGNSTLEMSAMGIDLIDAEDKTHPVTLIEPPTSMLRCIYNQSVVKEPVKENEQEIIDTLSHLINDSTNRRIHFFVIENTDERKLFDELPEKIYLSTTISFLQQLGAFKKTDGIYILVTKVDNSDAVKANDLVQSKYLGIHNRLQMICRENYIGNGQVEVIPFSVGEFCFKTLFKYNPKPADTVARVILENTNSAVEKKPLDTTVKHFLSKIKLPKR